MKNDASPTSHAGAKGNRATNQQLYHKALALTSIFHLPSSLSHPKALAQPPRHRALLDPSRVECRASAPAQPGNRQHLTRIMVWLLLLLAIDYGPRIQQCAGATITGNLTDISLAPLSTKLQFNPTNDVLVSTSGLSAGPPRTIDTTNGAFAIVLDAGDYTVSLPLVPWRKSFVISVPTGTNTCNLSNVLAAPRTYTYTNNLNYSVKGAAADLSPDTLDAKISVTGSLSKLYLTNAGSISLLLSNAPSAGGGSSETNFIASTNGIGRGTTLLENVVASNLTGQIVAANTLITSNGLNAGGNAWFSNNVTITGQLTNGALTGGKLVGADANKALNSITVGSGLSLSGATLTASGLGGTVTSVGLSVPGEYTVSGSPVTSAGTLTVAKANQSANQVYAGPASGGAGAPVFRSLVGADIPAIAEGAVTGLSSDLAGKVARAGDNQTNQTVTADSIGSVPLTVTNLAGASTNLMEFKGAGGSSAIGPSGGVHIGSLATVGASNLVAEANITANGQFNGSASGLTNYDKANLAAEGSSLVVVSNDTFWLDQTIDIYIADSFNIGGSLYGGGAASASGGSSSFTATPAGFKASGWVRLNSFPTNTGTYSGMRYFSQNSAVLTWQSNLLLSADVVLSGADFTNSEYSLGTIDNVAGLAPAHCVRWFARSDWSANWMAQTTTASSPTYATSALAVAQSTLYTLGIRGTTNSVTFYTNGVACVTLSQTMPGGQPMYPYFRSMSMSAAGSSGANSLWCDKFFCKMK